MKLIIDIGNTQTKMALFEGKKIKVTRAVKKITVDEIKKFIKTKPIEAVILSSVINHSKFIQSFLKSFPSFVEFSSATPIPIKNKYKTPTTLGYDRLANVIAAVSLFPEKNNLVIDAGTCIKYDFVNSKNEYAGGAISPGLQMRYLALNHYTAHLPLLKKSNFKMLTGRNTKESITSGVQNGITAEVESFIDSYKNKYGILNVLLTGGDYLFFANQLKSVIFAAPNLTLKGLNEILDYNGKK